MRLVQGFTRRSTTVLLLALWGCGSQSPAASAEPPRPEPLRLAGGDYPVGAHQQSLDDTLDASSTENGLAPGWSVEDGTLKYDDASRLRQLSLPPSSSDCDAARALIARAGTGGKRALDPRCSEPGS